MSKYKWIPEQVPDGMRITQVYCIMFDRQGRMMLRLERGPEGNRYSLAGGRPELYDDGIEATCRREVLEEVNTEIETPVYIGYQLSCEENGTSACAQVRMAAMIQSIGEKRPDPDNGEIYDRYMTTPEKAAKLLNWGDIGFKQVTAAMETVYSRYGIDAAGEDEEWV